MPFLFKKMDWAYVRSFDPKARSKLEKMPSEYLNYVKKWKAAPDHWGGPITYANLRILGQAIEKAGSLDRETLRKVLDNEKFEAIIGPVKFNNRFNLALPGMVLQWQGGIDEIIWPKGRATTKPLFPEPAWQ